MQASTLPSPRKDPDPFPLAACRRHDPAIFFPDDDRLSHRAKAICATCPHIDPCRQHALTHPEPYGVWGGLSESERRTLLSRRVR